MKKIKRTKADENKASDNIGTKWNASHSTNLANKEPNYTLSATKKEGKIVGAVNATSGFAGIISAHNVCHATCLGLISFLSIFGIMLSGMPLAFLTEYNLLFWSMGAGFLFISLILYAIMKRCMSNKLIVFNAGIVLIGVPFFPDASFALLILGGSLVVLSTGTYALSKIESIYSAN